MNHAPRRARFSVRQCGLALGSLCLIVISAWLAGRIMSDRFFLGQWLLWIPTPVAMLASLLAGGIAWSTRRRNFRRRVLWLVPLCVVSAYFMTIEHRLLHWADPAPAGLKLMHWTIAEDVRPHGQRVVDAVLAQRAEITVLTNGSPAQWQEVLPQWTGQTRPIWVRPFAIITPLPVIQRRTLIAVDGITVVLLELDATDTIGRSVVLYLIDLPSSPKRSRYDVAIRVRRLIDQTSAPAPDMVVGDFNTTRGSASLGHLFPALHHAFDEGGHGYGATFHRRFPLFHIDHVLLTANLQCSRYDIIDGDIGRHRAQVAWISEAP